MRIRTAFAALPPLVLAAAALAAPPLAIPIPRPTPEQEARLAAEAEEEEIRAEIEEARLRLEAAAESAGEPEAAPAPEIVPVPEFVPSPKAAPAPETPVAPGVVPATPPPPAPSTAPAPAIAIAPAVPAAPGTAVANIPPAAIATNAVFRRDPFWPVAVTRARKADHDARIAAAIEAEKRAALIEKKRQEAIARGEDVELIDHEFDDSGAGADPSRPAKHSSERFAGATEDQWDAALAKIPPRSGYLGGRKPALMLKGDKRPHYAGDELCVTNRGVVFTWRISSVDFRAYTHELERVTAKPVP